MKNKFFSILIMTLILAVMIIPSAYAATSSSNWNFVMDYNTVDGDANGTYHDLVAGSMTLTGNVYAYSKDSTHYGSPSTIYIGIYESVAGIDRSVGSTSVTPSTELYKTVPVSGSFGSQRAGKYYLQIYTISDDGWNTKGSGTLSNK